MGANMDISYKNKQLCLDKLWKYLFLGFFFVSCYSVFAVEIELSDNRKSETINITDKSQIMGF